MRVSKASLVLLFVLLFSIVIPTVFEAEAVYARKGKSGGSDSDVPPIDELKEWAAASGISVPKIDENPEVQERFEKMFLEKLWEVADPVLVISGKFIHRETDIEIPESSFSVKRVFLSEETVVGSFGRAWSTSLDSRILRGKTEVPQKSLTDIKGYIGWIETLLDEVNTFSVTPDETTLMSLETIQKILEENGRDPKKIIEELSSLTPVEQSEEIAALLEEINTLKKAAENEIQEIQDAADEAEELSRLNKLVLYEGTSNDYWRAGNKNLVLIDDEGTPILFRLKEKGEWLPAGELLKLTMKITSRDGEGAATKAGFILTEAGGVKKYYNGDGLLEAVEELNGSRVELIRNDQGRVIRLLGPHKNEWKFSYSEDGLISVIEDPLGYKAQYRYTEKALTRFTDTNGIIVQYAYEDTRLTKIGKSDGSFIEVTYGSEQDGKKLVTKTSHEEGASERIDYFSGYAVHTNHSGVITTYRYNSENQVTREELADGTIKTFSYNKLGQVAEETVNGFQTRYSYDDRGNVALRAYSDGTREELQWNVNDQTTRYVNRDGIVSELIYDDNGNCLSIKKGGETVFTGVYGERGKILEGQIGGQAVKRFNYNDRDFLINSSIEVAGQTIVEQWEHDALGRILKYTDGAGQIWSCDYSPGTTKTNSPLGLETVFTYNNRNDLVSVAERDTVTGEKREKRYVYDKRHLLTEEIDGAGNKALFTYRADGEPVRKEQGPWYLEYGYDAAGRIITATQGKTGSYAKYTETYGYQLKGWNEERTISRPGSGMALYHIDNWKQVTQVTNALGESSTRTFNGAGEIVREQGIYGGFLETRHDTAGRMVAVNREGEKAIQLKYNLDGSVSEMTDRMGNVTRYIYDGRGLLTRGISALGEERYQYDGAGRLTQKDTLSRNSGAYRTELQYRDGVRTVTITEGGTYIVTLYQNAWGEIIRRVDGEGNETRYEYDGAGNLKKETDGYGKTTSYTTNDIGLISSVTYSDGTTMSFEYDHLRNLTEMRGTLGVFWAGVYDEAGRLSKETGWPGINREYKYDVLGRITEVLIGGEVAERYRYTNRGQEVVFTDGEGKEFAMKKNSYGKLVEEANRLGDLHQVFYDANGRLNSEISFSGKQFKMEYRDAEGKTIRTFFDGTQSFIEQDLIGNIVLVTGETGTIRYKYDSGGRLIEQNDENANEAIRYAYDKAGRRIRMQSGNRDVQYRYGRNGELLYVADNSQRLEVSYEYDSRGRETRRTYGNGIRQETQYDLAGRVVMIRELNSGSQLLRAEGYLYDNQGRRSHSVDEEGKVTKYEYDRQSRLSAVLYPWTKEKAESDRIESEEAGLYFTPEKGSGERSNLTGTEQTTLRDLLNKAAPMRGNALLSSQMIWRESYTYDRNGNRATKTTPWGIIRYEYDAENRLVKKGDIVYNNDKDGNVLGEKGLRYEANYEYNGQNRMVRSVVTSHVEKTHVVSAYAYDAFGRRTVTESVTGQTLRTLYDGQTFEVIREGESYRDGSFTTRNSTSGLFENGSGTLQSGQVTGERYRWVGEGGDGGRTRSTAEDGYTVQGNRYGGRGVMLYGNGEAVAMNSSIGSRSMYLGKDMQGSVRSVTVGTGALEARYEYDAFGQPYTGDLGGGMNFGYTGKPYDTSTGLYNYGYRDYRPQAARFTTVDPVRDGNNWFAYVNNDPVNWTDPWGLMKSGLDINMFAEGSSNRKNAHKARRPDYAFVIGGHGDSTGIRDSRDDEWYGNYNLDAFYGLMTDNGYQDGQVVILKSCETGRTSKSGEAPYAQYLADYLAQKNEEGIGIVFAPAENIITFSWGASYTGPEGLFGKMWYLDPRVSKSAFMFGGMEVFIGLTDAAYARLNNNKGK